jgi:hypothetical protein
MLCLDLGFLQIQFPRFKFDYSNKDNRICSLHFTESVFYRDLQSEMLEKPTKLILRENVVPSINVLKKKLCHKIFEKPRKKQKFDNIFDRFCFTHKPSYSNCFLRNGIQIR